jgi:hypothetical protein
VFFTIDGGLPTTALLRASSRMSISRKLLQTQPATGGGVVWTDPDLTTASYESLSFSVSSQETLPKTYSLSLMVPSVI